MKHKVDINITGMNDPAATDFVALEVSWWGVPGGSVFITQTERDLRKQGVCLTHDEARQVRDAINLFLEADDNARLIAAAPDLLNAIRNSDDAHWTPAMRAAMAKALGTATGSAP